MGDDRFLYCARKKSAINFTSLPTVRLSTHKQFSGKDERDDKKKTTFFHVVRQSSMTGFGFWVKMMWSLLLFFIFHRMVGPKEYPNVFASHCLQKKEFHMRYDCGGPENIVFALVILSATKDLYTNFIMRARTTHIEQPITALVDKFFLACPPHEH